ncbi:MAG TPA: FRG domain-containing protein [Chitinophagaceae bacterium]
MSLSYSKSWIGFLEKIEAAKNQIGFLDNEECFYRGHSHTDYLLLPGLYRGFDITGKKIPVPAWNKECDLFYEFRSKAKELHSQNLADWDILFFMQHHGVRTRLLDWSESLGVAIYFSLCNYRPGTSKPCIWIMNPYKLNEEYHDSRDLFDPLLLNYYEDYEEEGDSYSDLILYTNPSDIFPWDVPIGLYPVRRVDRLTTQSGYFTIHGNDSRPIEKIVSDKKNICKKIEIPTDAIDSAFAFLEHAGINQFTLFPDMDGLAAYLNKKYFKT